MKNILTFAASSSKNSINKKLSLFTANLMTKVNINGIDLNDYEMPIYSVDKENESGFPKEAIEFKKQIDQADGIIISFAEHNGSYAAAYKNIYDWVSRIDGNVWQNKPMFLLATSPGARGAQTVLEMAFKAYGHSNKNTIVKFSLPSFNANFNSRDGISDKTHLSTLINELKTFEKALAVNNL